MSRPRLSPVPEGAYPERRGSPDGRLERLGVELRSELLRFRAARTGRWAAMVLRVREHGASIAGLEPADVRRTASQLGQRLRREGFQDEPVAAAFALVREVAAGTTGLRPFDVQVVGGWILLQGLVAEMETGEGKTLTATLPAATAALAGIPVHIITVNDYLAARDAEWMGPIYRALGLSVGVIVHGMAHEARQAAYACDVTYCTNKELVFDYLRDRLVLGRHAERIRLQVDRLSGGASRV